MSSGEFGVLLSGGKPVEIAARKSLSGSQSLAPTSSNVRAKCSNPSHGDPKAIQTPGKTFGARISNLNLNYDAPQTDKDILHKYLNKLLKGVGSTKTITVEIQQTPTHPEPPSQT
jgi:hypothetical protein